MTRTVYLAGPINGCTDDEATGWRQDASAALSGWTILDPMRRDYRGREAENADAIVEADLADIDDCEVVLVNATRASWGTAMEIAYAHDMGKLVVAFGAVPWSPWLTYHCDSVHPDLLAALRAEPFVDAANARRTG